MDQLFKVGPACHWFDWSCFRLLYYHRPEAFLDLVKSLQFSNSITQDRFLVVDEPDAESGFGMQALWYGHALMIALVEGRVLVHASETNLKWGWRWHRSGGMSRFFKRWHNATVPSDFPIVVWRGKETSNVPIVVVPNGRGDPNTLDRRFFWELWTHAERNFFRLFDAHAHRRGRLYWQSIVQSICFSRNEETQAAVDSIVKPYENDALVTVIVREAGKATERANIALQEYFDTLLLIRENGYMPIRAIHLVTETQRVIDSFVAWSRQHDFVVFVADNYARPRGDVWNPVAMRQQGMIPLSNTKLDALMETITRATVLSYGVAARSVLFIGSISSAGMKISIAEAYACGGVAPRWISLRRGWRDDVLYTDAERQFLYWRIPWKDSIMGWAANYFGY